MKHVNNVTLTTILCLVLMICFFPAFGIAEVEDDSTQQKEPEKVMVQGETIRGEELDLPDSDTLFSQYVDTQLKSAPRRGQRKSAGAGNVLTGVNGAIYAQLSPLLPQVADGDVSSTVFVLPADELDLAQVTWTAAELGLESIYEGDTVALAALEAVSVKIGEQIDLDLLLSALLADNPYNLYWYDKTSVTGYNFDVSPGNETLTVENLYFYFPVLADYAVGGEEFTVDASVAQLVQTVKANAQAIVAKYANKSDYDKLDGYRKEICDLVSYNYDALAQLNAGTATNGNPWQLLWVFDGDPATNVVCEGYAKAFQYLCDLTTTWKSNLIRCITVTGTMSGGTGAGDHMWNVVRMEDGNNYLVDVTNCDSGSVGAPRGLFLAGSQDSAALGVTYTYNAQECAVYDNSALLLHETAYLTGVCGDELFWAFNSSTGTLTITGSGEMWDYSTTEPAPWHPYCGQILALELPDGLTTIGEYAFYGCTSLGSITLPESVEDVGAHAFDQCTSLAGVNIPSSLFAINPYTFADCTSLQTLTLPESLYAVDNNAFSGCTGLENLTLPGSLTLSGTPFAGCTGLKKVTFTKGSGEWIVQTDPFLKTCGAADVSVVVGNGVKKIPVNMFANCTAITSVSLPSGLTAIDCAFRGCTGLKSITIPSSVTGSEGAFFNCSGLTSATIQNSVIGIEMFLECSSLTSVTISSSVTTIDETAFTGCTSLMSITLPESVKDIREGAFARCTSLTSFTIPQTVTHVGRYAFLNTGFWNSQNDGPVYKDNVLLGCKNDPSVQVTIKSGTRMIADQAFNGKSGLAKVTMPNSVISIGEGAFAACTGLKNVTMSTSITSIGDSVFSGCTGLTSITIPNSVNSIGRNAFSDCTALTDVDYHGTARTRESIQINSNNSCLLDATWHYLPVNSIEMAQLPDVLTYDEGQALSVAGGQIKAYYDHDIEEIEDLTLDMVTGFDSTEAGVQTLTVTFGEKTLTYDVTVNHIPGDPVRENEIPATAEAEGSYDEVVYCTVCHEELSREKKTIDKLVLPTITTQPSNATAGLGATATFRVTASNATGYQWQYQRPNETTWYDVQNGGRAATFNQTDVAQRHNGFKFRCKVSNAGGSVLSNVATLTLSAAPTITTQPSNATAGLGSTATFKVVASNATSYQWQYQRPNETSWNTVQNGGQAATFNQTNVAQRHNGFKFRCKVSNAGGSVLSNVATLTLSAAPTITTQPSNVTAGLGSTATFTVVATNATGYQWQYQRPNETTWNTVQNGGQAATFNQTDVAQRHNGFKFRCKVSNAGGSVLSNEATLTLSAGPTITTQPTNVTASLGSTATFRVVASNATSHQWQYQRPNETTWNDVQDGGRAATFNQTNVAQRHNGFKFRCKVSNAGGSVLSNEATLTVGSVAAPTITSHPANVTAGLGSTATFTVVATNATGYQWQYQRPNETTWNTVQNGGQAATFNQTNVEQRHNGFKFRCKVSNAGGSVLSNVATLTVAATPTITSQPANVTASLGSTATFRVTASNATAYQWQYQRPNETTWNDAQDNGQAATFNQTNVATRHDGFKFRCKVSNDGGSVLSNVATLTVGSAAAPTITSQPANVTASLGSTATFRVTASNATGYQWQYKRPGETTWNDVQVNGKSATFNQTDVAQRHNGFVFRCKVTNSSGTVYSSEATLTVK